MGTYDVYSNSINAVTTIIQGLGLSGIDTANIVSGKAPVLDDDEFMDALPAVIVAPVGREQIRTYSNLSDEYIYPVVIVTFAADNNDKTSNLSTYLTWRSQILKTFHNRHTLTGVSEVYRMEMEPLQVYDPEAWRNNIWQSGILLRIHSKEPRP